MIKITAEWNKEHQACYPDERLASLYDRPMGLCEVLTRTDGPWDDVSTADRLWVFWRAATQDQRAATLERIVTRAVTNRCLDCGIDAVEQWAARWLSGEDRSGKAAKAAAELLDTGCAARAAEWMAARAARAAARAAAEAEWAAEWAESAARAAELAESAAKAAELAELAESARAARAAASERDLQLLDALAVFETPETIAAIDAVEGEIGCVTSNAK